MDIRVYPKLLNLSVLTIETWNVLMYGGVMEIVPRNQIKRVVGASLCPHQPERRGLSWSYPWKHMEPGHVIILRDTSPQARAAMASAAAIYGRRHGMKFSTGYALDFVDGKEVCVGWWCVRHDGCEIKPPEPTIKQKRAALARAEIYDKRRLKAIARDRAPRAEPPKPIGTYARELAPPLEVADYSDWSKPVPPEEFL